ncbi:MAG: fibronectin type III domain-containing protein [Verrucomicrobiia bacterium]|jgi:hypothetical protein
MLVKPSIQWINKDTDVELINDASVIVLAMTNNASIYPTPTPSIPDVQSALNKFSTGVAATADGGPSATSAKNNLRLVLCGLLRQLASYVAVACKGDMTNLLLSGFPTQKPQRQPIGVLPAPANLTVTLGARSGELDAAANPVFGASIYNWQLKAANAPTVVVQTAQTTGASKTFTGLTPGVVYTAEVNAAGTAGPSDWSNPVPQMVV